MKYIDEYRDPYLARKLIAQIQSLVEKKRPAEPVRLMEFCGGHTHAIFRFGFRETLDGYVDLRSGPGCPVCVTAARDLDHAIALAKVPDLILTTFGDMMRVPGGEGTLQQAKASGADVRMVYSPLDALDAARKNPDNPVVFLGVGFETTAPGVAAALLQAEEEELPNFSVLSLHKLTPPAMRAILNAGEVALDGIIGPGHVSAVIGSKAWSFLPQLYHMPCAVSGFEPLDILQAIHALVQAVADDMPDVFNTYSRGVQPEGNLIAQRMIEDVFEIGLAVWRGLGSIPASGLHIRESLSHRDAALLYPLNVPAHQDPPGCRCGEVLRGLTTPVDCPLFQHICTPRNPVGPCMVSAEGACAAYYKYQDAGML
jgi:hydrogenase expression/formation protein HypD